MVKFDENKYTITEKTYNGIKVRELKPIKTPEQDKKRQRTHNKNVYPYTRKVS